MKIMIVDDHPMVIEGCRGILSKYDDIELIEAKNSDEALKSFLSKKPDLVILDINMPGVTGFDLFRDILEINRNAKIIVFSMNDDPVFATQAIELGACGFLAKGEDPRELMQAIEAFKRGEKYLSNNLALQLAFSNSNRNRNPLDILNRREKDILRHIAEGKDTGEIAYALDISYKTVANNCIVIRKKLGARSKSDLLRIAVEHKYAKNLL